MDLNPDLLLSILFVAIIVNTAVIVGLIVSNRSARRRLLATAGHTSAIDRTLSTSYVDHSARGTWPEPVGAEAAVVADVEPEPEAEPEPEPVAMIEPEPEPAAVPEPAADADPLVPAGRDPLTGLLDATTFSQRVAVEEARVARYHRPATIVVFELDGLDRLVERLGQEAGDRVLPALGDTVQRLARGADHVARIGPGRFGVLLTETDEVAAINYVERVRRACDLWLESGAMALHLAIGWAGTSGDVTLTEAQRIALERMYAELRRVGRRADPGDAAEPTRIAS